MIRTIDRTASRDDSDSADRQLEPDPPQGQGSKRGERVARHAIRVRRDLALFDVEPGTGQLLLLLGSDA
jgi:hypothetical protein